VEHAVTRTWLQKLCDIQFGTFCDPEDREGELTMSLTEVHGNMVLTVTWGPFDGVPRCVERYRIIPLTGDGGLT
jgi:hypothetical protein